MRTRHVDGSSKSGCLTTIIVSTVLLAALSLRCLQLLKTKLCTRRNTNTLRKIYIDTCTYLLP